MLNAIRLKSTYINFLFFIFISVQNLSFAKVELVLFEEHHSQACSESYKELIGKSINESQNIDYFYSLLEGLLSDDNNNVLKVAFDYQEPKTIKINNTFFLETSLEDKKLHSIVMLLKFLRHMRLAKTLLPSKLDFKKNKDLDFYQNNENSKNLLKHLKKLYPILAFCNPYDFDNDNSLNKQYCSTFEDMANIISNTTYNDLNSEYFAHTEHENDSLFLSFSKMMLTEISHSKLLPNIIKWLNLYGLENHTELH